MDLQGWKRSKVGPVGKEVSRVSNEILIVGGKMKKRGVEYKYEGRNS